MQVPILTPENSFNFTCADNTCACLFPTAKPIAEVINQTMLLPIVIYHQTPIICPRCGATYRWVVASVQTQYGVQRMDHDLVSPEGAPLKIIQ